MGYFVNFAFGKFSIPMAKQEQYVRRRLYASSISTVVSIALVLFMLGLVGLIVLTSEKLTVMVKENIGFSVYLKDGTKEVDIIQIQKHLDAANYVKCSFASLLMPIEFSKA